MKFKVGDVLINNETKDRVTVISSDSNDDHYLIDYGTGKAPKHWWTHKLDTERKYTLKVVKDFELDLKNLIED